MGPAFPRGGSTRAALYWLGLLAALKALSLVLLGQAVAAMLAGLADGGTAWQEQLPWGAAGAVLRSLTVWAQGVAARRAAFGVKEEMRSRLLDRSLASGSGAAHVKDRGLNDAVLNDGGLAVLATRGLDALDNYYTQFLPALVNCATVPLLLGARILFADWISAVVIVLTVPLVPVFMVLIGRHTEDRVQEAQATLRRLSGHIVELAKGLPVLVGLGRASEQRAALEEISEQYRTRTMGTLRTAFLSALALELIATISVAMVAVFIGVRLVAGDMPLEAGLLALILAPDCYLPLRELGTAHHASDDGRAALAATNSVLEAPVGNRNRTPADAGGTGENNDAGGRGGVTVSALTVSYPGRGAAAVGPLDFHAPQGQATALVGPSGSGKSTVLGVLAGTLTDGAGASVTGHISGPGAGTVAWVPQHPVLLESSVLSETALYLTGMPARARGLDPGTVRRSLAVLSRVAADHLAWKHPSELSPGELRRVALARGLARIEAGATVLLLDEPTAHLDQGTARAVHAAIESLPDTVTVILVAHDTATVALAAHLVHVGVGGTVGTGAQPVVLQARGNVAGEHPVADGQRSRKASDGMPEGGASEEGAVRGENQPHLSAWATLRTLAGVLGPVRYRFAAAGFVAALAALFAVALSGLSAWLIIRAGEQPPILYLLGAIVGVRFFGIGRAVLRYWERLLSHDAVFAAMTRLRGSLWAALSRRALQLRRLLRGGNVLGSVVDDVDTLRDLLPRVVLPPFTALAVGLSAVLATGLLLPGTLAAVVAVTTACLVVAPVLALLADRRAARAEQELRSTVLHRVAAVLEARADLAANAVAPAVLSELKDSDRAATRAARQSAWAEGLGQSVTVLACTLGALLAGVLAVPAVQGGTEPAVVAVVVLMLLALAEPYGAVVSAVRQAPALAAVLRRVAGTGALAGARPDDGAGLLDGAVQLEGRVQLPDRADGARGLLLDKVGASWPGGTPVFTGLSAEAHPGRWLAVSGPSGSGKSTMLSVLLGFLPVREGSVQLSGTAAWCPQDAHLFDSTVRGNLLLARPPGQKPGEDGLWKALDAVGLSTLLHGLPDGLDTRIGPGGSFLSGGERQRLAMARTLLSDASVLLLDEPTAHLDAAAAKELLAQLRTGLADATVVLVTHNPADILPGDARLELAGPVLAGPVDDAKGHDSKARDMPDAGKLVVVRSAP